MDMSNQIRSMFVSILRRSKKETNSGERVRDALKKVMKNEDGFIEENFLLSLSRSLFLHLAKLVTQIFFLESHQGK